jgi:hypothetical protein
VVRLYPAGKSPNLKRDSGTVPMPPWTKAAIDDWLADGFIGSPGLVAVNKGGPHHGAGYDRPVEL